MPEDQVIEEEISEQESDPEAEAGFDEFADGEPEGELEDKPDDKPDEDKPEGDDKPETDEKPDADDKPDDKGDDKELSAKEVIDKRIEELEGGDEKPDGDKKPDGEKPIEEDPDKAKPGEADKEDRSTSSDDPQPPVKTRITKEQLGQHLAVISDDELPDGEVTIGDNTFNFKELKEDDPEVYNAMKVMSSIAGAKYLNAAIQSGKLVTADKVEKLIEEVGNVRAQMGFTAEMTDRGHGDFLGVIQSDGYQGWIEKESDGVKALARSNDPDDAAKVLSYYKESVGKKKAAEHDDNAGKKHKRKNDLLKSDKTTKPAGPGKKSTDENDDEASFNEHAE